MRFPRGLGVVLVSVAACAPARGQDAPASHRVGYTASLAGTYGNLAGGDFGGSKAAVGYGTGDYAAAEKGGRTSVRLGVRIGPTR